MRYTTRKQQKSNKIKLLAGKRCYLSNYAQVESVAIHHINIQIIPKTIGIGIFFVIL